MQQSIDRISPPLAAGTGQDASAPCLVVRLSETTLKGRNRQRFERQLARNVAAHLAPLGRFSLRREPARLTVLAEDTGGEGDLSAALEVLRGIPGVANLNLALPVSSSLDSLEPAVLAAAEQALAKGAAAGRRPDSFRLEVTRKNKRYPMNSMELASHLGGVVQRAHPELRVSLDHPDLRIQLEVLGSTALLFQEKVQGPGGLAAGTGGRALCLLSGGIDSPVAAYLMMVRGLSVSYLYFHSYPFIGAQSQEKVRDLVRILARYQPKSRLYIAPFAEAQVAIRDLCPERMRTILYRRMMNRVANRVAAAEGAGALITGESVGQVASQTLPNIAAIQETAALPVLQPLIGTSKEDIIHLARRIGTYETSIQPFPDCCTLFQPDRPETASKLPKLHEAEAALPMETLVEQCYQGIETAQYGPEYFPIHSRA